MKAHTLANIAEGLCFVHNLPSKLEALEVLFRSLSHAMSDRSRATRLGRLVQGPSVFGIGFSVRTDNTLVIFDLAVLQYMLIPNLYT